jgi:hypothetical protein
LVDELADIKPCHRHLSFLSEKKMTIDEIILTIKNRLAETGNVWSEEKIRTKASEIFNAGLEKMCFVGQAALNADAHEAKNYSPSQHLKVLTGDF